MSALVLGSAFARFGNARSGPRVLANVDEVWLVVAPNPRLYRAITWPNQFERMLRESGEHMRVQLVVVIFEDGFFRQAPERHLDDSCLILAMSRDVLRGSGH